MNLLPSPRMSFCSALNNLLLSPRAFLQNLLHVERLPTEDLNDLGNLSSWLNRQQSVVVGEAGEKVLLLISLLPLSYCIKLEGLIARAMQLRGYKVVVLTNLTCRTLVDAYHRQLNGFEVALIEDYLRLRNLKEIKDSIDTLLSEPEGLISRIKAFRYRGAYVGLHGLATLSASKSDGRISLEGINRKRLKRILKRSMVLTDASLRMIGKLRPSVMLGVEKGFVGTAEIFYAALEKQVDYVQWTGCHEPNSIMLKRYRWNNFREHPFSISANSWDRILSLPWDERYRDGVMAQFEAGYKEGAWFKYKSLAADQQQRERQDLMAQLGLDPMKKTAVIYSHILNDANLFYGDDLFPGGYEEWLVETVRAAAVNPEVNWVLKLHPANIYRNAKLGYSGKYGELLALEQAFGEIPDFLRVVYPEEKTSPLSFFKITDFGVTVRGTVGLELPCFGIPTLTAGTGRYAGKGFTVDSETRQEYLEKIRLIHEIPALTEEQVRLGQRYAYFVFRARPARYGDMFSDVYNFPVNHPRHRDVALGDMPLNAVLEHPQMQKIVSFLRSGEEDFLDLTAA